MAESTSPPPSRSTHKQLEYTSCIDTTLSPSTTISTCGNINAYSSFDSISQPHDCDSLGIKKHHHHHRPHQQPHRILERDLRRLDLKTPQYPIELNNKKLDHTESISLPTTPIEQISSTFNHQCHPLLLPRKNKTNNNNSNNENEHFRLTSSTNYMLATSEQLTDESISNSKRYIEFIII